MSSTASSSNRNNLWWFVWQDECSVRPFVFVAPRNKTDKGKPLFHHPGRSGTAGRKFSAVKHAEVPSDSEKKVTHVKLVFMEEEDRPRAVHIDNFYVGGNSFCKNFKDSKTVQEFVDKYNTLVDASPPENNDSLSDANSCDSFIASSGTTPDTDSDSSSQEPNTKMMEDLTEDLITANKKRKRLSEVCKEPTRTEVKKPKTKENTKSRQELIMENVQAGYCGHYKLNINNLALGKQVRSTDETFLGSLVEKMRVFSDDSYNALCVIVNVSKSDFCEQNIGGYKYHVIGGQHQYLAAKQLSEESVGGAFFKTRYCVVYAGLTEEEQLWLASEHNSSGEFRHPMTFQEKVAFCHDFSKNIKLSKDKKERDLRNACKVILNEKDDVVLKEACKLALLKPEIYMLVEEVMKMFGDGELKDQRITMKHLKSKPQMKKSFFRGLSNLHPEAAEEILNQVKNKEINEHQFTKELINLVKLNAIQQSFAYLTAEGDWEEAQRRYPKYATREYLKRYMKMSFKPIPPEFKKWCDHLKTQRRTTHEIQMGINGKDGAQAFTIKGDVGRIGNDQLKEGYSEFSGFQLAVMDLPKVWSTEELKALFISLHAINMANSVPFYNVVVTCDIAQMAMVKDGIIKSGNIENVEFAYYYVSNTDTGSAVTMAQSVFGVVVSYWSQQGTVTASQVNFDGGFSHHNFWSCTMEKLYRGEDGEIVTRKQKPVDLLNQLITQFSPEDGLVLDLCSGIGSTTVAALQCGRSCIAIENNTYKYDNLVTRLLLTFNTNDFNDSEDTAS